MALHVCDETFNLDNGFAQIGKGRGEAIAVHTLS